MSQTTTQNEKLRALLAEARNVIHQVIYNDTLQDWACESVEDEPSMEDILREMRGRIDATLAEPVETGGAVKGLSNERDHFKAMLRERAEDLVAAREEIERLRQEMKSAANVAAGEAFALRAARAEIERFKKAIHTRACQNQSAYNLECVCGADEHQRDLRTLSYRRGAEAMREEAANEMNRLLTKRKATAIWVGPDEIRSMPIPKDNP